MSDIEIIYLTKEKLRAALENNTYWKSNISPLPKSKALWLLSNTRIKEKDYCGLLALEENNIIGFIYMIPDLIKTNNKSLQKVYWMIYWYVAKKYENKVLSTYLYNEALQIINNQAIVKSYTENVSDFYKKMPFRVISLRIRHTIFFSLDPSILLARFNFLKPLKFFIKFLDLLISKILRFFNQKKVKKNTKSIKYEYINELDKQIWDFIKPLCEKDLIIKTKEYINWQINPLQYTQAPIEYKYSYSALENGISTNIAIYNLKIIKNNSIIGFISFVINYNELNIKYFLVKEEVNYNLCADALMEHLIKLKRNFIFTDDKKLSNNLTRRYKTIFTHRVEKKALAHHDVDLNIENYILSDRDGHFY